MRPPRVALALLAASIVALVGCGDDGSAADSDDRLDVVAGFYPLAWVTGEVGGELVDVSDLTPSGTEPHDLELSPNDVAEVTEADLVVSLGGFIPALDDAVASLEPPRRLDAADHTELDVTADGHTDEQPHAGDGDDDHAGDEGGTDPHFWLDPTKLAEVGDAVARRLAELDPDHAADYAGRADDLRAELERLDQEFADGLDSCASRTIVTSHEAFGYLARRYELEQVGISGISPDTEPSPAQIAAVTEQVGEEGVSTIFYETLVDPAVAETVASETGAATAVLDPVEGLSDDSPGDDYLSVMRANLVNLRAGLDCR